MNFVKHVFLLIALVAVLRAQDMEQTEDMESMEDTELIEDMEPKEDTEPIEDMEPKEDSEPIEEVEPKEEMGTSTQNLETANTGSPDMEAKKQDMEPKEQIVSEDKETTKELEPKESVENSNAENATNAVVLEAATDSPDDNRTYSATLNDSKVNSTFSCFGRSFGQYADVSQECRVFHLCYPYMNSTTEELLYQRISFECEDGSVFDQKRFLCADNSTIDHKCSDSEDLYVQTNQEYLIRVFSQNISPSADTKDGEHAQNSPSNWMSWLYNH